MDSKDIRGLLEAYAEVYAPIDELYVDEATAVAAPGDDGERRSYSAKAARAGKDIGKPGKAFAKIAASAAKRYGSKERGEKVAGAVLAKLRREESGIDEAVKGADTEMRKAASVERRRGDKRLSPSAGKANADKMERDIKFYDKVTKKTKPSVVGMTHEEVDVFDSILEYLVSEGYADNNQEALYIMANLSEEEILEYKKLAAGLVGGMMALNMMKPGVAPTGIKRQAPEPDKTELVSKADKEKKDAEERRQADLYAQSRVDQARRTGLIK